jgi:hypothetical protein
MLFEDDYPGICSLHDLNDEEVDKMAKGHKRFLGEVKVEVETTNVARESSSGSNSASTTITFSGHNNKVNEPTTAKSTSITADALHENPGTRRHPYVYS